jgi:hypothetical protein
MYPRRSSRTASTSHLARVSRCCRPSGVACPACSAIVQQFFPWQVRQQSQDEGPCATSRFDPREAARDPAHQGIEQVPPASGVYAMACGHRLIFVCPHNTR